MHLEETKRQQDRLKQLITDLGNGQKNAATNDKARLPIPTAPKSLTNIFLTQLANRMNAANAITILSESLSEERAMADWIKTNTPDMITQLWPEIEASLSMDEEQSILPPPTLSHSTGGTYTGFGYNYNSAMSNNEIK